MFITFPLRVFYIKQNNQKSTVQIVLTFLPDKLKVIYKDDVSEENCILMKR